MSIERVERSEGVVWRVRWREGGRNRSKVLGRKKDAEAFDAEIRRRKRTGELASLHAGKQTLGEFAEEWWHVHAVPNLSRRTREVYASLPGRGARRNRKGEHARHQGQLHKGLGKGCGAGVT